MPLAAEHYRNIRSSPLALSETIAPSEMLETGIKLIDLLCPFLRGGRTGLFRGAGERIPEGHELWHELRDTG
jgi:F-type H+-transporting ATPase subunit beta